jgi:hypothetical protein
MAAAAAHRDGPVDSTGDPGDGGAGAGVGELARLRFGGVGVAWRDENDVFAVLFLRSMISFSDVLKSLERLKSLDVFGVSTKDT